MRKILLFISLGLFAISCSSDDDGFADANGNVAKKYITKMTSSGEGQTNISTVVYNTEGKVISASDGEKTKHFSYDNNGNLSKISGGGSSLLMSEVFNTIYEGYNIGDVLQYDSKGNPSIIELYEDDYWSGERIVHTATISYDDKPFAFYYTLDAAGIIEVLNNTRLNFSDIMATPEIIMAKLLLPVNNPYKAIVKDENNQEILSVDVSYNYGEDKYPNSATVIVNEEGYVESYSTTYEYK